MTQTKKLEYVNWLKDFSKGNSYNVSFDLYNKNISK